jgi:hypothetical protein
MVEGRGEVVAVFRGLDGALGDPGAGGRVEFWAKTDGAWRLSRTMDFEPLGLPLPKEAKKGQEALGRLAEALSPASVVAARSFPGLCFKALLDAGAMLCEMPDFQPEWLDDMLEAALDPSWDDEPVSLTPVESPPGSGVFELDMTAALVAAPELSAQNLLAPFLDNVPFLELRVLLDHFPPWLGETLRRRGLICRRARRGQGVLLTISPEAMIRA